MEAQRFVNYIGNYDYYLEKHGAAASAGLALGSSSDTLRDTVSDKNRTAEDGAASAPESRITESKLDWQAKKEEQARLRKKENDLKKCEERIAALEMRNREIDLCMSDPSIATQAAKLQEFASEQNLIMTELETLYAKWEILAE